MPGALFWAPAAPVSLPAEGLIASTLDWHASQHGSTGLPLVLLLHGTGGSGHSWDGLLPHLAGQVHGLVPDLPGHGRTRGASPAELTLPAMAQALWRWLRARGLPGPALIAGHSAGAALALRMALDAPPGQPSPAILGFAPSLVAPPELYSRFLAPLVNPLATSGPVTRLMSGLARRTALIDGLLASTGSTLSPAQRAAYRALFEDPAHVRGAVGFMAAADLPALNADCAARAQALQVAFVLGARDRWIPERLLRPVIQRHLPQADVQVWPGGHLVHEESPARAAARVLQMLQAG